MRAVAAAICLLSLTVPAWAEDTPPLTLHDAVARALETHPALAEARAGTAAAAAAGAEARALRGPVVQGRLTGTRHDDPMAVSPIHGFAPDLLPSFDETLVQAGLEVTYTLWDAGQSRARLRRADAQLAESEAGLEAATQHLIARVVAAYLDVTAGGELHAAEQARVDALARELERARLLVAAGRAPQVEQLRADAELAGAEAELATSAARLDAAERQLAHLLGVDPAATRVERLAPPRSTVAASWPERGELEAAALAREPAVRRARHRVAAAAAEQQLARAGHAPRLGLVGSWLQFGDSHLDFESDWSAGLQLAVPVWDHGLTAQRVAGARAGAEAAEAALAAAELGVRSALDRALAAREEAAARMAALARAVAGLAEVARIELLRLEVGAGVQVDYLRALADLAATRSEASRAAAAIVLADVEIARRAGELDLEWIVSRYQEQP